MPDRPDNAGKTERQKHAEQRPGNRYDDFVERGNFRQPCAVHIRLTLDNVHRRKLGQRDKASERQRTERVLDTVDCLFPEWFTEPDAEFFYVKPSPAGGQKMSQFMDNNQQIKQDENLEEDEDETDDVQKHCH